MVERKRRKRKWVIVEKTRRKWKVGDKKKVKVMGDSRHEVTKAESEYIGRTEKGERENG